jgi:hypothetical protein
MAGEKCEVEKNETANNIFPADFSCLPFWAGKV